MSEGFDPDTDLDRVGLANQTTMLRNETMAIGKLLERTMMEKYGPADLKDHYMVMDTICDATQVCPPTSLRLSTSCHAMKALSNTAGHPPCLARRSTLVLNLILSQA